ncbi:hypothetical protein G9A89_014568 [Geosiphon pyriformis]|nr:hypothetical protein G9A89_014568 [Geosiphon pyriformis]
MKLIGSSVGGSSSVSAGLGTRSGVKSKRFASAHLCGASYKKPKKPAAVGSVVNTSAGPISLEDLGEAGAKSVVSWGSNVSSVVSSVSSFLDVENMTNLVAEEISYAESGEDNGMDKNMPKKTCTQTDNDNALELSPLIVNSANQVPHIRSCVPEKRNFEPVKFFALDIEVLAVPGKTNVDKLMAVKKIFYQVNGFGGASTSSKFPGIIRSSFTFEKSLIKARELAISEKILVNNDLRKVNRHSDREVIVKEIPVDLLKSVVNLAFFKFGKIVSIKMQLIGLWQKALVEFELSEIASLVAFKWSVFMKKDSVSKLAAIGIIPVFKGVSLHWTGLSLASCICCKQFGYVTVNCSLDENSGVREKKVVSDQDRICLAEIYKKKSALIACPTQIAGGFPSCVVPSGLAGAGLHSGLVTPSMMTDSPTISHLNDWLAILKHFLELLTNHVSGILVRLEFIDLVPVVTSSLSSLPAVSETLTSDVNFNMIVDTALVSSGTPPLVIHNAVVELSFSSSKVLTAKVGGLETKLIALEASVGSVLDKLNILCSGSDLSVLLSSQ